jgi:hypothetical protein
VQNTIQRQTRHTREGAYLLISTQSPAWSPPDATHTVMAGLDPAIHAFFSNANQYQPCHQLRRLPFVL